MKNKTMKIGMPILFEYNSLEENINLAKKLKLDFLELNLNFGYCRDDLIQSKDLKAKLEENDLVVTVHFYDEADFASYDEITEGYLKLLKKYLPYLKEINCKLVNIHLNNGPIVTISGVKNYMYEKEYDEYIKRLKTNLREVKRLVNEIGAEMVLENVTIPRFIEKTYLDLKNEFFFNYDIGHDNNDGDKLYNLLKDNDITFLEYHIHDGNGKKCHLALGEGTMDIKMYKEMASKRDNVYALLEVKSKEDLEKSVPLFKSY